MDVAVRSKPDLYPLAKGLRSRAATVAARPTAPVGAWPRFMRAATAAAYVDEVSVQSFRRKVGSVYPLPVTRKGSRPKWDRLELDAVNPRAEMPNIIDAASVL